MMETKQVKNLNAIVIVVQNEKYLLEVKDVKEIFIPRDKIVPIPLVEKEIVGVIDIRGDIYTIISLRHKIFREAKNYNLNEESRILLLEKEGVNLALLVDSVLGVQKIPVSIFDLKGTVVETQIDYQYIKSIGVMNDDTFILLDLEALLPSMSHLKPKLPVIPRVKKREARRKLNEFGVHAEEVDVPRLPRRESGSSTTKFTGMVPPRSTNNKGLSLSDEQKDFLKEIGNIGSGNAITALSRLIKKKIDVELTEVGIISHENLLDQFGEKNKDLCGIFCHIKGASDSTILQIFEMQPLLQIVADLAGKESQINPSKVKKKSDLDDYALSTITEMGNILAGHYASALADLTGTKMMIDIPEFTMSKARELGDFLINELGTMLDYIILIRTSIQISDLKLNGMFLFVPDYDTLETMFNTLNIDAVPPMPSDGNMAEYVRSMDMDNIKLNEIQRDALQEVGNIGAGNAANALAKMLNKRVDINIPLVEMTQLEYFAKKIGGKDKRLFVCWSNVKGKANATVLSIFDVEDIIELTSIIIEDPKKKQIDLRKSYKHIDDFPEIYRDAMSELGHILGSNYTSSIGDLLDMRLMTEPPDMSIDTGDNFFKILTEDIGIIKELSIIITTDVIITDVKITGTFLYIPEHDTILELLDALSQFFE